MPPYRFIFMHYTWIQEDITGVHFCTSVASCVDVDLLCNSPRLSRRVPSWVIIGACNKKRGNSRPLKQTANKRHSNAPVIWSSSTVIFVRFKGSIRECAINHSSHATYFKISFSSEWTRVRWQRRHDSGEVWSGHVKNCIWDDVSLCDISENRTLLQSKINHTSQHKHFTLVHPLWFIGPLAKKNCT